MSKGKRDSCTSEFKFKMALEAMKDDRTLVQPAGECGVHPSQIGKWKEQLKETGASLFNDREKKTKKKKISEAALMEKVGRLTVEVDWLKKKTGTGNQSFRTGLLKDGKKEKKLPFIRKCRLLDVSPSTVYSKRTEHATMRNGENIAICKLIEEIYLRSC